MSVPDSSQGGKSQDATQYIRDMGLPVGSTRGGLIRGRGRGRGTLRGMGRAGNIASRIFRGTNASSQLSEQLSRESLPSSGSGDDGNSTFRRVTLRRFAFPRNLPNKKRAYEKAYRESGQNPDKKLSEQDKIDIKYYLTRGTEFTKNLCEEFPLLQNEDLKNLFLEAIVERLSKDPDDVELRIALEKVGLLGGEEGISPKLVDKIMNVDKQSLSEQILTGLSEYNLQKIMNKPSEQTEQMTKRIAITHYMNQLLNYYKIREKIHDGMINQKAAYFFESGDSDARDYCLEYMADVAIDNPRFVVDAFEQLGLHRHKDFLLEKMKERYGDHDTVVGIERKINDLITRKREETGAAFEKIKESNKIKKIVSLGRIDSLKKLEKLADFVEAMVKKDLIDDEVTRTLKEMNVDLPQAPRQDPRMILIKISLARTFNTLQGTKQELPEVLRESKKWQAAALAKNWIAEPLISKLFSPVIAYIEDKQIDLNSAWETEDKNMTDHGIKEAEKLVLSLLESMKCISNPESKDFDEEKRILYASIKEIIGEVGEENRMLRELCGSIKKNIMEKFKNLDLAPKDLEEAAKKTGLDYFVLRVFNPLIVKAVVEARRTGNGVKAKNLMTASGIIQKLFNKTRYQEGTKMAVFNKLLDETEDTIEIVKNNIL